MKRFYLVNDNNRLEVLLYISICVRDSSCRFLTGFCSCSYLIIGNNEVKQQMQLYYARIYVAELSLLLSDRVRQS